MGARYATCGVSGKRRRAVGRVLVAVLLAAGTGPGRATAQATAQVTAQPTASSAEPGDGLCAVRTGRCGAAPRFAVLAAFPGELRPLLERASVREGLRIGDRVLRVGTLGGVPVVLGLLGIGLANAEATTALVLDRFDMEGVIVSGVAGAPARIGDVTIPVRWAGDDGTSYDVDPTLLRVAERAAPHAELTRCAAVPPHPPGPEVCVAHEPRVLIGGTGSSDDPFGGRPVACVPGGDDVFGCDVAATTLAADQPAAVDMETTAAARVAHARGVPFVGLRAVSDGDGDPLGLPGFPAQFFSWYGLAAHNAAAMAEVLLEQTAGRRAGGDVRPRGAPRAHASCAWERRAAPACGDRRAPRALRARVDRACRLAADPGAGSGRRAGRVAPGRGCGRPPRDAEACRRRVRSRARGAPAHAHVVAGVTGAPAASRHPGAAVLGRRLHERG